MLIRVSLILSLLPFMGCYAVNAKIAVYTPYAETRILVENNRWAIAVGNQSAILDKSKDTTTNSNKELENGSQGSREFWR